MRWSHFYIPTLKEAPGDAETISHKLLLRAGMIRKLTAGIYTWLPLGLRALNKASAIMREEMNRAGALEILMPAVQPGDLWRESGRWTHYGKELLRFKDRHDRDYCLGPTHEEVVTDLIRGEVRSYRQLPLCLYQIQTKFRDEIRPRFGLMRGREFVMKDAYSFDRDDACANISYKTMYDAYKRIFSRMGLLFRPVEADSGAIGGNFSHEFMVVAETGEDTIAYCTKCDWSANVEHAPITDPVIQYQGTDSPAMETEHTPGKHTVEEIVSFLQIPPEKVVKTLLYVTDGKPVAALVRGDRELNEIKLKKLLKANEVSMASPEQIRAWTGAPVGFAGPVGFTAGRIVADKELLSGTDWVVGANMAETHIMHVDLQRDVANLDYADLRVITEADVCPHCSAPVKLARGIEVGHIFKLGTKYSKALGAIYLDETGNEQTIIMGCYGIGVSRVVAACVEQSHDDNGIIFPPALAPFDVELINLDPGNATVSAQADELYICLTDLGFDVLFDDREERPGVKFKDADLIGLPVQITLGGRGLARGIVELKNRKTGEKSELQLNGFAEAFAPWYNKFFAGSAV